MFSINIDQTTSRGCDDIWGKIPRDNDVQLGSLGLDAVSSDNNVNNLPSASVDLPKDDSCMNSDPFSMLANDSSLSILTGDSSNSTVANDSSLSVTASDSSMITSCNSTSSTDNNDSGTLSLPSSQEIPSSVSNKSDTVTITSQTSDTQNSNVKDTTAMQQPSNTSVLTLHPLTTCTPNAILSSSCDNIEKDLKITYSLNGASNYTKKCLSDNALPLLTSSLNTSNNDVTDLKIESLTPDEQSNLINFFSLNTKSSSHDTQTSSCSSQSNPNDDQTDCKPIKLTLSVNKDNTYSVKSKNSSASLFQANSYIDLSQDDDDLGKQLQSQPPNAALLLPSPAKR